MARTLAALLVVAVLSGCNCGGGHSDGGTGGGGGNTHAITGHRLLWYRLETTEVARTDPNLSTYLVQVPSGPGFADRTILGTDTDGGFIVTNVDPGVEFFIGLGGSFYISTTEREIDLDDHNNLGRPGLGLANNDSPVTLTISGMAATSAPDFRLVTPNTGFYGEAQPVNPPAQPVTALNAEPASFTFTSGALPDGTSGDQTWIAQRIARDAGSSDAGLIAYHSTDGFAVVSAIALSDDGGVVTAALAPATQKTLDVTVSLSDYTAHLAEIHPMATVQGFELNVYPAPTAPGLPQLWAGYSGSMLDYFTTSPPARPLSLVYADGYPAAWNRMVGYDMVFNVPAALPNTTGISSAFLGDTVPLSQLSMPLKPRLSPVTQFKVDGMDAFAGGITASLTPLLTWSAPAVGAPSGYLVSVYKLILAGGTTRRFQAGTIATTATHCTVPPGIISPQGIYVFRVSAELSPGLDLAKHPLAFATAVDIAVSDVFSGQWNSE